MAVTVHDKMTELADAVRSESKCQDKLSIDRMISEVHKIPSVIINDLFSTDSSITDIVYTGSLIRINNAFSYMPCLTSATLTSIQRLPQGTFNNSKQLKKVDLGADCSMIESMAFWNCDAFDTLILRRTASVCYISTNAFTGTPIESGTGYIYVYEAMLAEYETDSTYVEMGIKFRTIEDYPNICGQQQ